MKLIYSGSKSVAWCLYMLCKDVTDITYSKGHWQPYPCRKDRLSESSASMRSSDRWHLIAEQINLQNGLFLEIKTNWLLFQKKKNLFSIRGILFCLTTDNDQQSIKKRLNLLELEIDGPSVGLFIPKMICFCIYVQKWLYLLCPQPLSGFLISHWVQAALQQLWQIIARCAVCAPTNPLQMRAWCWLKDCNSEKFAISKSHWLTHSNL